MAADTSVTAKPVPKPGTPGRLLHLYREHVEKEKREERFLIALSYIAMFLLLRFITHSIKDRRFTWLFHDVSSGKSGLHVHHFVFGIIGLLIAGYIAIALHPTRQRYLRLLAVAFGVCAALIIDEFALWLNLKDVYWTMQGRESVEAAFIVGALTSICVAGRGLFAAMGRDTREIWRDLRRR
ncbi:MAG: hypothetical protein ACYDCQ_12155 [Dehalococcoidia bacterium]